MSKFSGFDLGGEATLSPPTLSKSLENPAPFKFPLTVSAKPLAVVGGRFA